MNSPFRKTFPGYPICVTMQGGDLWSSVTVKHILNLSGCMKIHRQQQKSYRYLRKLPQYIVSGHNSQTMNRYLNYLSISLQDGNQK